VCVARTNKYSPELGDLIIDAVRKGAFRKHAAAAVGVTEAALNHWLVQGRDGREPYVSFATELDRAVADDAIRMQDIINRAAESKLGGGDWRAAAWNLERKHPTLYGARQVTQIQPTPAEVTPPAPTPEPRPFSPFLPKAHDA